MFLYSRCTLYGMVEYWNVGMMEGWKSGGGWRNWIANGAPQGTHKSLRKNAKTGISSLSAATQ
jgi:hypothetical protein